MKLNKKKRSVCFFNLTDNLDIRNTLEINRQHILTCPR